LNNTQRVERWHLAGWCGGVPRRRPGASNENHDTCQSLVSTLLWAQLLASVTSIEW